MNGTVSNLITAKGYGFITGDDGQEYFFHKEEARFDWDSLVKNFYLTGAGQIGVVFEAIRSPKGPRAKSVNLT